MAKNLNINTSVSGRSGSESAEIKRKPHIKVGKHGADLIMTSNKKKNEQMLSLVPIPEETRSVEERIKVFSQLVARATGLTDFYDRENCPDRIGFNLTNQAERDVLFAVLKSFTDSDYRGDFQIQNSQGVKQTFIQNPDKTNQALSNGFDILPQEHIGGALENIPSTPVWRVSQKELLLRMGYDPDKQSDVQRVSQAVLDLATKQNFLMWTRFKRDKKTRKICRDKSGKFEFELVSTFSPVLWVNFVSDPKTGKFQYYEISPSPVFLDEVSAQYGGGKNGYFLLIPEEANREIDETFHRLFPSRVRISPTIQTFCFWLRLKVQERQGKENNPFTRTKQDNVIVISYRDLCQELDISEKSLTTQRKRTRSLLDDGLRVAIGAGYLNGGTYNEDSDEYRFELNLSFYPQTRRDSVDEQEQEPQQMSLF